MVRLLLEATGHDTEYIKTVRVESARLTAFWGTPMTLEACVLLPWNFHEHPTAKYPTLVAHSVLTKRHRGSRGSGL